jgi:hypothetical protein
MNADGMRSMGAYRWVTASLEDQISEAFGSVVAFEDNELTFGYDPVGPYQESRR